MAFSSVALLLHIAAGFLALLIGPVAMFSRKGGAWHLGAGRTYVWAMLVVVVTAAILALRGLDTFLFALAVISFYLTFTGWRAALRKGDRIGRAAPLDWAVSGATVLFGLGLMSYGLMSDGLMSYGLVTQAPGAGGAASLVALVMGALIALLAVPHLIRYRRGSTGKGWLIRHIIGMLSAYIATFTAFAVTNLDFLPPAIGWVLPTVLGSLGITLTVRHYRTRLERGRPLAELVHLRRERPGRPSRRPA
ncbi:MAG: hypothetical protein WD314_07180 [Trueperaceae bacterium]